MVSDSPTISEPPPDEGEYPDLPAPWGRTLLLIILSLVLSTGICWCLGRDKLPNETGKLTGYTIPLVSDWTGKIESFLVQPGDLVQEGDPIAVLVDERLPVQIARKQREVDDLKAALWRAEQSVDAELTRQLAQIDAQIATLTTEEDLQLATEVLARSAIQDVQMLRLEELQAHRISLPHRLRDTWGIDRLRRELVLAETELNHIQSLPRKMNLPAPATGQVHRLLRKPGERIVQGTPLLELADQAQPYLVVEMPEPVAKRFALGDEIPLKFPGQENGMGRVANMQRLESPEEATTPTGEESESSPRIRVMIEPEDGEWPKLPLESAVKVRTSASNALSRRVH